MKASRFIRDTRLQSAEQNSPALQSGERGDAVRILQQALVDQGFAMPKSKASPGADADGIYGAETVAAVSAFQKRERLAVDGKAGKQTLGRLDEIFLAKDRFFGTPGTDNPRAFAILRSSSRSKGVQA